MATLTIPFTTVGDEAGHLQVVLLGALLVNTTRRYVA